MTEKQQPPDRFWSVVDIPKTLAGALAAVCAAVVGSYLGVAGTLVGAAVASVVGSVGTEIYGRSLERGAKKLQTLTPSFVRAPAAVGTPPVAAATAADSPSHTETPAPSHTETPSEEPAEPATAATGPAEPAAVGTESLATAWKRVRWGRVAMVAGALFVLAIGALTVTELITGKSVASSVGNSTKAPTTLGGLLNPGDPTTAPASPSPSPSPSATTTPSVAPSTTAPGTGPTTGGVPSSATPSTATPSPTTGAPSPTPTVGLGQNQTGQMTAP